MKKIVLLTGIVFLLVGCNNTVVIDKPDNLIEKDKMVDIFYDLTLLEAMRSQNPYAVNQDMDIKQYIYKKYKIDSLQLTQSNRYYVSHIEEYKAMYEKVNQRIEAEKKAAEDLLKKEVKSGKKPVATESSLPDTPQVQ